MAGFVCIDSAIANTAIEYAAEMTASAKTELISTTLKNIYLRRQRAASRKIASKLLKIRYQFERILLCSGLRDNV